MTGMACLCYQEVVCDTLVAFMGSGIKQKKLNSKEARMMKREDYGRNQRGFIVLVSVAFSMVVGNLVAPSPGKYTIQLISSSLPTSLSTTISSLGSSLLMNNETNEDGRLRSDEVVLREHLLPSQDKPSSSTAALSSTHPPTFSATNRVPEVSGNKTFIHFYSHIPKTGGYYAAPVLYKLMQGSPQYKSLNKSQLFRMCNQGVMPTNQFSKFPEDYRAVKCTMWMTEAPWTEKAKYIYTVTRDPRSHVISQYFHCTESKDHASRRQFMPDTLLQWVQAWVEFDEEAKDTGYNRTIFRKLPSFKKVQGFRCYDPRNMQSWHAKFNPDDGDGHASLEWKYRVLGDLARMDQTVCAIATEYLGYVPPACDCTGRLHNHTDHRSSLAALPAHGVQHHGASHKTTAEEDKLIARLVRKDRVLYNHATEIFGKQLKRLEAKYGVSICEKLSLP